MRGRYALVALAAAAVGILAGWAMGSAKGTCEQSCPASGPCPEPPGCGSHPFSWLPAIMVGLFVTALIAAVAIAVIRRSED
jgi:hypothetical protein